MKAGGVVAVSLASAAAVALMFGGDSSPPQRVYAMPGAQQVQQAAPQQPATSDEVAGCVVTGDVSSLGLTAEQLDVARRGIAAANRAGAGQRGADIIIATGIVESGLRNLNHGDRDSLGWLQQRPSQGWANATDVDKGADDFFKAMVELVPDWQTRDKGEVAQRVQRSGFPDRYGQEMADAERIVATLTGSGNCATVAPQPGTTGKPAQVLAWAQKQVGKPYIFGANGPNAYDCSSFTRAAFSQVGVNMPRTAQAQRDWCAAGNCERVSPGQELPGDLLFWDSYLGPSAVGHVVIVKDPTTRTTTDARSTKLGIINGKYPQPGAKNIFELWRVKGV